MTDGGVDPHPVLNELLREAEDKILAMGFECHGVRVQIEMPGAYLAYRKIGKEELRRWAVVVVVGDQTYAPLVSAPLQYRCTAARFLPELVTALHDRVKADAAAEEHAIKQLRAFVEGK